MYHCVIKSSVCTAQFWILISIVIWAISVKMKNLLKTGTKDFSNVKLDQKESKILHLLQKSVQKLTKQAKYIIEKSCNFQQIGSSFDLTKCSRIRLHVMTRFYPSCNFGSMPSDAPNAFIAHRWQESPSITRNAKNQPFSLVTLCVCRVLLSLLFHSRT